MKSKQSTVRRDARMPPPTQSPPGPALPTGTDQPMPKPNGPDPQAALNGPLKPVRPVNTSQ